MGLGTTCSRGALTGIAVAVVVTWLAASDARAAGATFCEDYARQAVRQADLCRESKCNCPGKPWSQDYTIHYNWCRHASDGTAERVLAARRQQLWRCGRPSLPQGSEAKRGRWQARSRAAAAAGLCPVGYPERRGAHCYRPCPAGFSPGDREGAPVCFRCPPGFARPRLMPNGLLLCYK